MMTLRGLLNARWDGAILNPTSIISYLAGLLIPIYVSMRFTVDSDQMMIGHTAVGPW